MSWRRWGKFSVLHMLNMAADRVIQLYNAPRLCFVRRLNETRAIVLNQKGSKMKIEIKKIGNSDGLLLPKELMQRLDLKRGQELHVTELAGGGLQLMPYDPDFEETMRIADQTMDQYRDTLAALAK
jgi:putative addiction module antidote